MIIIIFLYVDDGFIKAGKSKIKWNILYIYIYISYVFNEYIDMI